MTRKLPLTLVVLACMAFATRHAAAIGITPPSWEPRETVAASLADSTFHSGSDQALAYDHHGNPGIAFLDAVDDDLRFAQRLPGFGWVHSTIDTGGDVGWYPSLAFDRHERPAISYFDATNSDLKFAHFDGTTWNVETVDASPFVGVLTSLAFDRLGHPAIAYQENGGANLKYVRDTDGDFSFLDETPVEVDPDAAGYFATLRFDPLNRPMIAHRGSSGFDLRFSMENSSTGWQTTTVDGANSTGWYSSLDIDPDTGYPAIAYYDSSFGDLRYAEWDGVAWQLSTIDSTGQVGRWPSIAFDPADGNPAISYLDDDNDDLKLAWHDGTSWQTQTVDSVGSVGWMSSLAFNDFGSGFPSIAYFEETGTFDTLYFINDPPAPVPEPSALALLFLGAVFLASVRRRAARGV